MSLMQYRAVFIFSTNGACVSFIKDLIKKIYLSDTRVVAYVSPAKQNRKSKKLQEERKRNIKKDRKGKKIKNGKE
jgi:hypothetical protein